MIISRSDKRSETEIHDSVVKFCWNLSLTLYFCGRVRGCYIYKYAICLQKFCNKTMPFTKSKIQSNLSSLRARKEQDVDLGFSCFPRIFLILFSASSIGKVSGSRLLHSGPDKLLKLKCAPAQSSSRNKQLLYICLGPIQICTSSLGWKLTKE